MHTVVALRRDLERMGIAPDDTLLVHSSFKSIGAVEGGADGVLDAFMKVFGAGRGLLVFPTLTYANVKPQPPFDCNVFSVNDTPTCVGILTELFRRRPGVVRSWHPTHSVAAWGSEAAAFTSGHERFDSPCARTSPWGRLWNRHGKVLFIGVDTVCNTLLHGVEEWADVPDSLVAPPTPYILITPDGQHLRVISRGHKGKRWFQYPKLEGIFESAGIMTRGKLGDAECRLLDIATMTDLTLHLLAEDIDLFGHDRVPVFDAAAWRSARSITMTGRHPHGLPVF